MSLEDIDDLSEEITEKQEGHIDDHKKIVRGIKTLKTVKSDKTSMSINVKDYGAVGDGVVDDTQAVLDAITNLPINGALFFPTGSYRVSQFPSMPEGSVLSGEGPLSSRIIQTGWNSSSFITWAGSLTATPSASVTTNLSAGTSVITLDSTTGLTAEGHYVLGTNTGFSSLDPTMYKGELICIKSINSSTSITIYGNVRDFYSTAASSKLFPVSFKNGGGIRDISIVNSAPGIHKKGLVQFYACKNIAVDNVHLDGGDLHGMQLNTVLNGTVSNVLVENGKDDTANGFTGYGINVTRTSENITITGCRFYRVRHGFTCDSSDGNPGIPRNIVVSGCVASDCTSAAFDTHSSGSGITFVGCSATRSQVGFQLRSKDTRIVSCSVFYCSDGIFLNSDCDGASIVSTVVRSIKSNSAGRGIKIDGSPDRILVKSCVFDNLQGNAIEINSNARRLKVIDNIFSHIGGDNTRKTAIKFNNAISAGIGQIIVGNRFIGNESATSSESSVSTTQMDYAVDFGTGIITESVVAQNFAVGLSLGLVNNAGTNTVSTNVVI